MKRHKQESFPLRESPEAKENIERISPREVRQGLESGRLLLVCAYEDESRFRQMQLAGGQVYRNGVQECQALKGRVAAWKETG